eukprot:gene9458-12743_t
MLYGGEIRIAIIGVCFKMQDYLNNDKHRFTNIPTSIQPTTTKTLFFTNDTAKKISSSFNQAYQSFYCYLKPTLPCPKLGIKVRYLRQFVKSCCGDEQGDENFKKLNTYEVNEKYVKPATKWQAIFLL